ncbi:hypothetical protein [Bacillus albus]|uniref:hypothetical protein n=1 Tax=Bacillus albus TaxID=2026189 RepID=UPI0018A14B12|nr:hypothetical protein [Bacillus albus]MBF7155071.1 hypothetical protein [Bacillus albus]
MLKWPWKKKSYKGIKIKPANTKPHDSYLILQSYSEGFNNRRIFLELILPIIFSLLAILVLIQSNIIVTAILLKIKEINSQIAPMVAIQTGFNMTCLSLITSFNKDKNTFSKVQENKKGSVLKQLISSFAYCVFIQTGILIFGVFYNVILDGLFGLNYLKELNIFFKKFITFIFFTLWLSFIIHSFMVFLRNVILIYKFILVSIKK